MYYHLYIEYLFGEGKNAKMQSTYLQDEMNVETITQQYLKPFIEGVPMMIVSGRVVRAGTINVFRVLETDRPLSDIILEKNNNVPRGCIMFYRATDLLSGHFSEVRDITNNLISKFSNN